MTNKTALPAKEGHQTTAGNYFISNYPPFSFWQKDTEALAHEAFEHAPVPSRPLGLYVHIPFCRQRCHFCYFKVYTDKNSKEINMYLDAVKREMELVADKPAVRDRKPQFVYFGGGTPSFLSPSMLHDLAAHLQRHMPWDEAEEVAFECEPGTLNEKKLTAIREIGVTRLSLGVENFDDSILENNNRAHRSGEIDRAYDFARSLGFAHINIDLIAGMIGETEANWQRCIEKTIAMAPDSVTIYQMEIPFNTEIYQRMKAEGKLTAPVADWSTKRRWVAEAFAALEAAGYTITSAYTAVRNPDTIKFVYRDSLWTGADMLSLGVASFGIINNTHYQNLKDFGPYVATVNEDRPPLWRAYALSDEEAFRRQFILHWKLGRVDRRPFIEKFGIDPFEKFADILAGWQREGHLTLEGDIATIDRATLLRIDELLPPFFLEEHQNMERYV